ncbi:NAD(P)H-dependent oxidoreductase [Candidatus Villigracilis saccharophilus]|uniref:NAD(P)H-dependent oxidoreductase n=1 Tax=Candidatus Villigracilis saccharophilus TaxID=3140684 RepID=UPI0031354682|nr:NAD(P)H-dependent oxidoreductase [Anaerolineales bacterium]
MKTLILDGSQPNDPTSAKIEMSLQAQLSNVETLVLCEQKIGNCAGDFLCWVRSPGMCNTNDDNRIIAEKIMQSDLVIYLTPVTFGGYSSALKRMVDHQIQNISPFFATINGEIHHQPRYKNYPDVLTVGWMDQPNAQSEAVFRQLVHRNAINMYAITSVSGLVNQKENLDDQIRGWLDEIKSASSSPMPALSKIEISSADESPIRRAALLVGSPRTKKSTSASLGGYLMEQLNARGVETETIQVYTSFNSAEQTRLTLEKLDQVDLIVLAFPLYVDNLPAPVIAALEKIAAHRASVNMAQSFAAIANCGFPEAKHNDTALAICEQFAKETGMTWLDSLSLGGGEGLVHGVPLNEMDGRALPLKKSLELAATSLALGKPISQQARDIFAKPFIPNWLYKLFGGIGWKQQAKQYVVKDLAARPYEKV